MAVEKLIMMNIVGKNEYVDSVIKDIILFENVQVVDAYSEIDNFRFTIDVTEENISEILGFSHLQSGLKFANKEEFLKKMDLIKEIFEDEFVIDKDSFSEDLQLESAIQSVTKIYDEVHKKYEILKLFYNDLHQIDKSIQAYQYLTSADIEMEKLNNLSHFTYTIGTLSSESVDRLKRNYGNITAIVVHVGSKDDNEVYVIISPKDLETETNRILKSLNFSKIEGIKPEYTDKPTDIIAWLQKKKLHFQRKVDLLEKEVSYIKNHYKAESNYAYNVLYLYGRIHEVKKDMAFSKENFYFSGWIPERLKDTITATLSKYEDIIIMFNDNSDNNNIRIPTKLKNNWLFKPFEYLIKMYGIPSYNEIDPTPFLSITYLFLFGFMFGDIGQGFILLLGGLIIQYKGIDFGSIITRLGISSMFFGAIYGSVFGFETLIPALWLKPFDNINTILTDAVIIGVILLFIAYTYGIINQYKAKEYYACLLSKNGVTGFVLYFCLLLVALPLITGNRIISMEILLLIIIAAVVILFFKEPIINKLSHQKSNHKISIVENFFEIFEILMSMVSNTVSFIRVGAFALNHVGLFLAFESMAELTHSYVGSAMIYIIGNIFILILEGMIVGIQVLRLQYYELFSKYFIGGGEEFKPAKLQ
ncbi:MAG: V-type ATP synthase subunit I [Eubacteriales bacterium]